MINGFIATDISNYLNTLLDIDTSTLEKLAHKYFMSDYIFKCLKGDLTQIQLKYYLPSDIPLRASSEPLYDNSVITQLDETKDKFFELYFFYKGLPTL